MASATGIPERHPATITNGNNSDDTRSEHEPLLGQHGDVSQKNDQNIVHNLLLGTASVAQAGIWILAAIVWNGVFTHDLIFFSPHPLLNSTAVLLTTQAILILQPTHTPSQKRTGTLTHFALHALANTLFLSALIIIEINKSTHPETRFTSIHGILGLTTYILILLQAGVGVAQYFFPAQVFGSVDKGKGVYKWHRLSGYLLLGLELVTIAAATGTAYNRSTLHIRLWAVVVAIVLVVAGVGARAKRAKLPRW
ncbi:hypothetical protein AJ80_08794 [Polytolypa hystricis UAMH7299]|uniref:Cytochrome b561 domain-containing protein n=1 Tax=Polytolypa hystricis (strain UAMH7299) TaxID=1447883 RepID=A0A2B7WTZ0_POLH7|nr:hypothetical protein AJ80_08794 [Polytolypa hystricis UAMH7299]